MAELIRAEGDARGICDEYVGVVENGEDGIAIGVPGELWADEYIAVRVHEDGCEIVDDDGYEHDSLFVRLSLDQLAELRLLLDEAEGIVRQRGTRSAADYEADFERIVGKEI